MGLFKRKPKYSDRVWLNSELKLSDLHRGIKESHQTGQFPLCVFHFRDFGRQLEKYLTNQGLKIHNLNSAGELDSTTPDAWFSRCDVLLMDSEFITKHDAAPKNSRFNKRSVGFSLHLAEHYPIPEPDELLLNFAFSRKDIGDPVAYVALDEPWLAHILGDRVSALLEKLGVDENECIQHPMVSSSIQNAQEKLGEKVQRDFPYDSIEAWLAGNIQS